MQFNHPKYSDEMIEESIKGILEHSVLLSMASIKSDGGANESWINAGYYAFDERLNIYYLTPPSSQHAKNLEINPSVAVSIFDSHQMDPTKPKQGLQIFGTWSLVSAIDLPGVTLLYAKRFPWLGSFIKHPLDWAKKILESRLYQITPKQIKIFDEPTFGKETWVEVTVGDV